MRLIKKYPNRRLYDTTVGRYITLQEIKKLVIDRSEFKVVDARTEKDLTQGTLLQIITEEENIKPIFTTPILQELIRFYNEKSQDMLTGYLEQAMHLFLQQKDFFEAQWELYQSLYQKTGFYDYLANTNPVWPPLKKSKPSKKQ